MENGSSVICSQCNGQILKERFEAHRDYWCPKLEEKEEKEENPKKKY